MRYDREISDNGVERGGTMSEHGNGGAGFDHLPSVGRHLQR